MSSMFGILKSTMKYTVDSFDQTTAATDVVVIRHRDGTLHSSPFHVRFGRFKVVRPGDKCVQVEVNGELTGAVMKMGGDGLARWLKPARGPGVDGAVGRANSNASSEGIESPVCSPNIMPSAVESLGDVPPVEPLTPTGAELNADSLSTAEEEVSAEEQSRYRELLASMADPSNTPTLTGIPHPQGRPRGHSLVLSGQLCGESPVSPATASLTNGLKLSKMASVDCIASDSFASPFSPDGPTSLLPRPSMDCKGGSDEDGAQDGNVDTPATYRPPDSTRADDFERTPLRTPAEDSEARTAAGTYSNLPGGEDDDVILDEDYDSSEYSDEELYDDHHSPYHPQSNNASMSEAPQLSTTDTPPSSDLEKLNLKEGMNVVRYITVSALQGKVVVEARIYLWGPGTKICICDVDGTITKSDLMGHVMSMVGKDYTHEGICEFFEKVSHNGYQFLYLTARSVSHSAATRGYFNRIDQEGKRLPDGPLMTAPARFFDALTQEVRHRSHEFKIACLEGVKRAFPTGRPFYAGFGNRINDVVAYSTCGVPEHKVFIIDDQSVIHVCKVKQTYRNLSHLVNETFPPLKQHQCVQQYPHRYAYAGMHSLVSDQIDRDQLGSCSVPPILTPKASTNVLKVAAASAALAGAAVARAAVSSPVEETVAINEQCLPVRTPSARSLGSPASFNSSGSASTSPAEGGDAVQSRMSWDGVHDGDDHDDANFNSYNFWRCDPRDIVAPPKPTSDNASRVPTTAPKSERHFGNLWGLRGNGQAAQQTPPHESPRVDHTSSATSRGSSVGGTTEVQVGTSHTSHPSSTHRDPTVVSPPLSPSVDPSVVPAGGEPKAGGSWLFGGWSRTGAKPPVSPRIVPTEGQSMAEGGAALSSPR